MRIPILSDPLDPFTGGPADWHAVDHCSGHPGARDPLPLWLQVQAVQVGSETPS